MKLLSRILSLVSRFLSDISAILILLLMGLVVADVFSRSTTGDGVAGLVEYSEVLLVVAVFLGVAYARQTDAHVSMDMVTTRLPRKISAALQAAGLVTSLICVGIVAWVSLDVALESFRSKEYRLGIERVPVWPGRGAIAIAWCLLFLELLRNLLHLVREPESEVEGGITAPSPSSSQGLSSGS